LITPKPIMVTADPLSKVYGADDPATSYQVDPPLVSGDAFSGALSRTPGENVGAYAILQHTLTAGGNYAITYVSANLTIIPIVTVTVHEGQSKVYGENDPVFTYNSSDPSANFLGTLSRAAGEDVGAYPITIGTLAAEGYHIHFVSSDFLITPKPITVTADPLSKVYGADDPATSYQVDPPLVSGDAFSGALSRTPGENVGVYAILQNTLTAGDNYAITYISANLTITKRPITVTADNLSKIVGADDPGLTYQVTNGSLAFDDQFTGSLEREPGEVSGTYAILQGTLAILDGNNGANYSITFVPGNFMINFTIFLPLINR
jgi:hypothetical protein